MTSGNFFLFHREPLLIRWSTTQSKRRWAVPFLAKGIGNKKPASIAGFAGVPDRNRTCALGSGDRCSIHWATGTYFSYKYTTKVNNSQVLFPYFSLMQSLLIFLSCKWTSLHNQWLHAITASLQLLQIIYYPCNILKYAKTYVMLSPQTSSGIRFRRPMLYPQHWGDSSSRYAFYGTVGMRGRSCSYATFSKFIFISVV